MGALAFTDVVDGVDRLRPTARPGSSTCATWPPARSTPSTRDTGERCNLLAFGATDDRVVMSQYCGTYGGGVRDDRVQILTTDGDQVVTLQDSGIEGALGGSGGTGDIVTVRP